LTTFASDIVVICLQTQPQIEKLTLNNNQPSITAEPTSTVLYPIQVEDQPPCHRRFNATTSYVQLCVMHACCCRVTTMPDARATAPSFITRAKEWYCSRVDDSGGQHMS